jgi:Fe-S cluster biogenesis protein NfuA
MDAATRHSELEQLREVVAPIVAADGGELHLEAVDLEAGIVAVTLSGACSACAVSQVTLEAGIERILRQRLTWVTEVRKAVTQSADMTADRALGRDRFTPYL